MIDPKELLSTVAALSKDNTALAETVHALKKTVDELVTLVKAKTDAEAFASYTVKRPSVART